MKAFKNYTPVAKKKYDLELDPQTSLFKPIPRSRINADAVGLVVFPYTDRSVYKQGGLVSHPQILSQDCEDGSWIFNGSKVIGENSRVSHGAVVYGSSEVYNSTIEFRATVFRSKIYNSHITEGAKISDTVVKGAYIGSKALIEHESDYIVVDMVKFGKITVYHTDSDNYIFTHTLPPRFDIPFGGRYQFIVGDEDEFVLDVFGNDPSTHSLLSVVHTCANCLREARENIKKLKDIIFAPTENTQIPLKPLRQIVDTCIQKKI